MKELLAFVMMKLKTLVILSLGVCLLSCHTNKPQIKGDIANLPDIKVYLCAYDDGKMTMLDSTYSRTGKFSITIPDILPDLFYVSFEGTPGYFIPVIIDGREVYLNGNFNYRDDIRVSGTPPNEDLATYRDSVKRQSVILKTIDMGISEYQDSSVLADSAAYASLLYKRDSLKNVIASARNRYIKENPGSIVSAMFASESLTDSSARDEINGLLNRLDTALMPDNAFLRKIYKQRDETVK